MAQYSVIQVSAATQPSFLQHAVHLDPVEKRLCVLGEVNRRFVVSPDIDTLLTAMEQAEQPSPAELEDGEVEESADEQTDSDSENEAPKQSKRKKSSSVKTQVNRVVISSEDEDFVRGPL